MYAQGNEISVSASDGTDRGCWTRIYLIRGHNVMLSEDLAELYGVSTRALNQAAKRKRTRFPEDFMFQLARGEFENLKSQFVISSHLPLSTVIQ